MEYSDYFTGLGLFADYGSHALICCHQKCKRAIPVVKGKPTSHLSSHGIPLHARAALKEVLRTIDLRNPDTLAPLEDGSPAHPQLKIYDGYICRKCDTRTTDFQLIKKHSPLFGKGSCPAQATGPASSPSDEHIGYVYLQTWTPKIRRYWIVEHNGTTVRPAGRKPVQDHLESVLERETVRSKNGADPNTRMLSFAEQSPWLERAGWEAMLKGRDRELLSAMIEMPRPQTGQPHVLFCGDADCPENNVVSTLDDERRIAAIMNLVDPMMDRCEQTARSTSRNILCWVRSVKPLSSSPEPFQLVRQPSTTKKYRHLHKRLLAFVLRTYRLDPMVRERLTGIRLSTKYLRLLDSLWQNRYWNPNELLAGNASESAVTCDLIDPSLRGAAVGVIDDAGEDGSNHEDDDDHDDGTDDNGEDNSNQTSIDNYEDDYDDDSDGSAYADSSGCEAVSIISNRIEDDDARILLSHDASARQCADEVLELVFGLSVVLFEERPIDGRLESMIVVLFSSILGYSKSRRIFLPARDFTTHLSALIYNQRLVLLERALPVRAYLRLGFEARPRSNQLQRLNKVRKRFLVSGSASSFDEFFSLRNYGRVAAQSDTPPFLLHWSDDGQSVWWKDSTPLTMSQFRQLSRQLIKEAESLCHELMYGLEPTVSLASIKDDMTNKKQGYSFVSDPVNNLHHAYLELSRQACTAVRRSLSVKGRWKWKAVDNYLRIESRFRVVVGLVMQETGGQAARWSELLSLLCENSEFGQRGLFAFKSHIIYIIRHHKAKRSTNREHNVVRFLPAGPSRILYKYLAYIRPFVDLLQRERHQSGLEPGSRSVSGSQLLFRNQGGPGSKAWPTGRFNDALRKETEKVRGQSVNSKIMRQLRIGITEKHVREIHQPFNRYDDRGPNASRNAIFAHQSGHRPRQRGTNYGLDGAFPTTLQPQLLELYEWASMRWHEFLQLPSKQAQEARDSTDCDESHDSILEASKQQPVVCSATAASTLARKIMTEPAPAVETIPAKRKFSLSCGQQLARHDEPQTKYTKPSNFLLHPGRSSLTHIVPPTSTDKTNAVELHSSSLRPPVRPYYVRNDLNNLGTHSRTSSAGFPIGPHRPPLSSNTTQDSNKHQYLIHGRNLAVLHDKQQELNSFNVFLHQYLTRRQSSSLMHERLSRMIETTKWWGSIGCPLCFLCEGTEAEHTLHRCKRDELRNKALPIIRWLEYLRIPQHTSKGESCSICLSFYACGEAADTTQDSDFGTYCTRDSIDDPYSDGRCEIKPIIRMAIASLAAYDGHLFANMLAKVPLAIDAEVWFERKIPYDGHWFSNLLLVYEEIMLAFYYTRNMRRGKGPLWRFPSSPPAPEPPAYSAIGKAYPKRDTAEEVTSWEAAIGRWDGKCPICAGRGLGGQAIQHTLRQCTRGGSQTLRSELAEAMYEEGIVPKNGCDTCHIPYDFCDDWAGMDDGEWVTITTAKGALCQFEPHLLWDTIIGLYHCGQREIVDELHTVAHDYCVQRGMTVAHDQKTIALALSQPITVTGVAGSQLLRTLVVLTSLVLYKVKRDKEDENSVHLL